MSQLKQGQKVFVKYGEHRFTGWVFDCGRLGCIVVPHKLRVWMIKFSNECFDQYGIRGLMVDNELVVPF